MQFTHGPGPLEPPAYCIDILDQLMRLNCCFAPLPALWDLAFMSSGSRQFLSANKDSNRHPADSHLCLLRHLPSRIDQALSDSSCTAPFDWSALSSLSSMLYPDCSSSTAWKSYDFRTVWFSIHLGFQGLKFWFNRNSLKVPNSLNSGDSWAPMGHVFVPELYPWDWWYLAKLEVAWHRIRSPFGPFAYSAYLKSCFD